VVLHRQGKYAQALQKALQGGSRSSASSPYWWRFRLLEQEVRMSLGQRDQVLATVGSLEVPTALPGWEDLEARRLMLAGWVHLYSYRFAEAETTLSAALRLASSPGVISQIRNLLGMLDQDTQRPGNGEAHFQASLAAAREAGDAYLQAAALGNLGFSRIQDGHYEEALYYFQQVLKLSEKLQSASLLALTYSNLGWCNLRLGREEQASRYFRKAWQLMEQTGLRGELHKSIGNVATQHQLRGDLPAARRYFEQALRIPSR
jgi:Tetratricopeptide repeat.